MPRDVTPRIAQKAARARLRLVGMQLPADGRMDPVGADEDVAVDAPAVGQAAGSPLRR